MNRSIAKLLALGADLPEEALPGEPVLELLGSSRVLVEHHGGILEYGTERICVRAKYGTLQITGSKLQLLRMLGPQLIITGSIDGIRILKEGK